MEVEASSARLTESAQLIIDCLENVIPYILYKRMVYPRSDFQDVHKFGMGLVTLRDPELTRYISLVLKTAHDCALKGVLQRVVLCIIRITTRDVLERWQFRVLPNGRISLSQTGSGEQQTPHSNETHGEIAQIIKQIGVSFLPPLDHECSFKLLLYTTKSGETGSPVTADHWIPTHPHYLLQPGDSSQQQELVQLRDVSTPTHKIAAEVVYLN